jgi:hypothetical protein
MASGIAFTTSLRGFSHDVASNAISAAATGIHSWKDALFVDLMTKANTAAATEIIAIAEEAVRLFTTS